MTSLRRVKWNRDNDASKRRKRRRILSKLIHSSRTKNPSFYSLRPCEAYFTTSEISLGFLITKSVFCRRSFLLDHEDGGDLWESWFFSDGPGLGKLFAREGESYGGIVAVVVSLIDGVVVIAVMESHGGDVVSVIDVVVVYIVVESHVGDVVSFIDVVVVYVVV